MIRQHRKLELQDFSGSGKNVIIEINWNKKVGNCEYLKICEAIIKKSHLFELLMLLSDEKQQERMISTAMTYQKVRNYQTVVDIQSKADIAKGQIFGVPLTISFNEATGSITVKP